MKTVINARMKWKQAEKTENHQLIQELSRELSYSPLFISLCLHRGLDTKEKIQSFLHPSEKRIYDPFLMHDMERATERIMAAVETGDKIIIYGDYDADGVTSTSVLLETLEMIGANVDFYIPNRFIDGYGPNSKAFEKLINEGCQLIVTCDNGVSGHEAIKRAKELGVDVVVTDHHELPEELPDAYAIVHPRHPAGQYPFGDLAGVGVAFKVATALLGEMPVELLDLVALGTIADLVSLRDENRVLVTQGIALLKQTQRLGLVALYEVAGVKKNEIDEESVGFIIGPRLNAPGRLGDASPAVRLLTTFDENEAQSIAQIIQGKNEERQQYVKKITDEAFDMLEQTDTSPDVYVLAKEGWHEGVLGIVASKIVGKTGKPAIILNIDRENGTAKGSGRSVQAFHLYEALGKIRPLTVAFGGHHMAAGLTVPSENIEQIRSKLNDYAAVQQLSGQMGEEIHIDKVVTEEDLTLETVEELKKLAPFGTDNPKPTFQLDNVLVQTVRKIGADGTHLKMSVQLDQTSLDTIGFDFGEVADRISGNTRLSTVGKLEINEWNGSRKLQLRIEDIAVKGIQCFDYRSTQIPESLWNKQNADFVFFDSANYEQYQEKMPASSKAYLIQTRKDAKQFLMQHSLLVLVDCPPSLTILSLLIEHNKPENVLYSFHSTTNDYLEGMPNRQHFANAYKFILSHQNIDVKNQLGILAKTLNMKENRVIFILQVFFEVGFVKIESGLLNRVETNEKKDLTQSITYQKKVQRIEAEERLVYSHAWEVEQWLMNQITISE
ncbi:single-stranded-DNA-specific exonuclease RecJ [Desemzia sp. FAM 24101]|uniref:single-stranded-DNA-specific exonuclease RecJ n=1 Tax=Desemzia sp. FAM 24101 TaxID=3259522 RepID=UPI00388EB1FF